MSGIIDQLSDDIYVQVKQIEQRQINDISCKFDEHVKQIAIRDIKIASLGEENQALLLRIQKLDEENRMLRTKLEESNLVRNQALQAVNNHLPKQSILVIQQPQRTMLAPQTSDHGSTMVHQNITQAQMQQLVQTTSGISSTQSGGSHQSNSVQMSSEPVMTVNPEQRAPSEHSERPKSPSVAKKRPADTTFTLEQTISKLYRNGSLFQSSPNQSRDSNSPLPGSSANATTSNSGPSTNTAMKTPENASTSATSTATSTASNAPRMVGQTLIKLKTEYDPENEMSQSSNAQQQHQVAVAVQNQIDQQNQASLQASLIAQYTQQNAILANSTSPKMLRTIYAQQISPGSGTHLPSLHLKGLSHSGSNITHSTQQPGEEHSIHYSMDGRKMFKCEMKSDDGTTCDCQYTQKHALNLHQRKKHPLQCKQKDFICKLCSVGFDSLKNLKRHHSAVHRELAFIF